MAARIAAPLAGGRSEVRTSVERNDACFVAGLHEQHDVCRGLNDLVVAKIARAVASAEPRHAPRQAAKRVTEIFRAIGPLCRGGGHLAPLAAFSSEGGNVSVRWIGDERCM